jgi:choline dehydrogenase-like flavoprotein
VRSTSASALPPADRFRSDVVVVGAGPAGITLATELDRRGIGVVVIEAGPAVGSSSQDDQSEELSVGATRAQPVSAVRSVGVGGTSRTWSGRLAELDSSDFLTRGWVQRSGWPFRKEALAEYYLRARAYLDAQAVGQPALQRDARARHLTADPLLEPYFWSYSRQRDGDFTRFGPRALRNDDSIVCFTDARATRINLTEDRSQFRELVVKGPDGHERYFEARAVVLCGGAIENARLLLHTAETGAAGLGAENVGRYLMDHPRGEVARFASDAATEIKAVFSTLHRFRGGHHFAMTPGLALTAETMREHELLNCAMWVAPAKTSAEANGPVGAPGLVAPGRLRKAVRFVGSLNPEPRRQLTAARHGASPLRGRGPLALECILEQAPDPSSRVRLSTSLDRHGVPRPQIDWRVSDQEKRTAAFAARAFMSYCRERGLPVPAMDPALSAEGPLRLPDVAHPIGTTRMASTPNHGVVDADGQIFGVENVYVAGSSTFPTSGHANPTLTIVALALRLSDHLAISLRHRRR